MAGKNERARTGLFELERALERGADVAQLTPQHRVALDDLVQCGEAEDANRGCDMSLWIHAAERGMCVCMLAGARTVS